MTGEEQREGGVRCELDGETAVCLGVFKRVLIFLRGWEMSH